MTKLLLRLFVKEYECPNKTDVRGAIGTLAGITGIVCNVLLFAFKLTAGVVSGAVSILADALNNLSDAASSVVTLFGFRLAQRPADADHPYGHGRYEYISGLVVAALIFVIGIELGKSSVEKIFHPASVSYTPLTVVILTFAIAVKLWMCIFYKNLGKKIDSSTLKAASIDSRNDVITSAAVLLGCAMEWLFSVSLDGYIGLAVAAFIVWSGVGVARETISPLLGQRADEQLVKRISKVILNNDKVLGLHDLLVHDYGPGQCFASVHVEISATENPLEGHEIIDSIECSVLEELNVHLVIHYDPVLENDSEWREMSSLMKQILQQMDADLSMHSFRIVPGKEKSKLVFDLAVPFGKTYDYTALNKRIDQALQSFGKNYETVIRFDEK